MSPLPDGPPVQTRPAGISSVTRLKEACPVEPREEQMRELEAPEVREEPPRPRRFRIVKLEERVAPQAGKGALVPPTFVIFTCI